MAGNKVIGKSIANPEYLSSLSAMIAYLYRDYYRSPSLIYIIMDPIPYYYDTVNRHAVVVKPKQPLLDWINALYPDFAEDGSETTVYLVKNGTTLRKLKNG